MEEKLKELDKLQNELRDVKVLELSEAEYQIFKAKADRVSELMHELYEFR